MKKWSFFGKIFSLFSKLLLMVSGAVMTVQAAKEEVSSARTVDNDLQTMSTADIIEQLGLEPLLQALSVEKIAKILDNMVPEKRLRELVKDLIQDKQSPLGAGDKLELLFALAALSAKDAQRWPFYFDLIVENYAIVDSGVPVLYSLVKSEPSRKEYESIVPLFVTWYTEYSDNNTQTPPEFMNKLFEKSMKYAVSQDDFLVFDQLVKAKPIIDKQLLNDLLWLAVENKKDVRFIDALIALGADPDYSSDDKHTMLMRATLGGNEPVVKQLLQHKADPEKVLDTAIGSAQQIAHDKGFVNIELLFDKGTK